MSPDRRAAYDRVLERRRAVALARHCREFEGLSNAQVADRLGRSPATIKAYFYDPTGEKARAVKARYVGVCRGCGAYTQPRNGKRDAYRYWKRCHPGAIQRKWTRELVVKAMREWRQRYGSLPSSYDWSRTHADRRGGAVLARLTEGDWPSASVASALFGSWQQAREAARTEPRGHQRGADPRDSVADEERSQGLGSKAISLPKPRESTAKSTDLRGDGSRPETWDFQVFPLATQDFAHNSGR
jgi:AraC-like DNA-binding protein